jgi:nitronate monooxygenase
MSALRDRAAARNLLQRLRLPAVAAPMFLVSGVELVVECCRAGVLGTFPAWNARSSADLAVMLDAIDGRLAADRKAGGDPAPYGVNLVMRDIGTERFTEDLALVRSHRVPVVITSVGDPSRVVEEVHGWGGIVLHDVVNLQHARKAAEAGVDGLILVSAGAGGHAGTMNPFAFVPQVREMFDGLVILAGAISEGRGIWAAQTLGADLAYLGTRFIATREAMGPDLYKEMLVASETKDIVYTPAFSGVPANYLEASIRAVGLDPKRLPAPKGVFQPDLPPGIKAWRDVWSGGHGTGMIHDVPPVAELVDRLAAEYEAARRGV